MGNSLRMGDRVVLPPPFETIVGRVIRIFGEGDDATVMVEYPLEEGSSETLTKGYRAARLTPA